MTFATRLAPAALIALTVVLCALPWGTSPELRLVLPLIPYVVIHRCVERWGEATPDWLVFLAGFAVDVAGQGPLGYWSLIYLCGFTMLRSTLAERSLTLLSRLYLFTITIVTLALMQWSISSLYYLRRADFAPIAIAVAFSFAAYLVLMILVPAGDNAPARRNASLQRGS